MPLTVATYNVKNLLDPGSQAAKDVLPAKLRNIASMLRACDADVVGLQEIGSEALLAQVLDHLDARGGYAIVMGTADARGIACALLSRVRVRESRVHTAAALPFPRFRQDDPPPFGARIPLRRGVVHACVEASGLGPVHVLVGHFKSSRPVPARDAAGNALPPLAPRDRSEGYLRSLVWRASEALYVRGVVDDVLAREPGAHVAAVGDFNDVATSPVLRALRGDGPGALLDCTSGVDPSVRFSHYHDARPVQIDHVLATPDLFGRASQVRFLNDALRMHDPPPPDGAAGAAGQETPTADSDHAPLVVRFG
jgi:endonuclease/exonuclease/phosphatase family metal-dependent hydrolase